MMKNVLWAGYVLIDMRLVSDDIGMMHVGGCGQKGQ